MPRPVTDDERADVLARLRSGQSYATVAGELNRGVGTIARIAKAGGFQAEHSAAARTRAARAARSAFCAEVRAEDGAKAQEAVRDLLGRFSSEQTVVTGQGQVLTVPLDPRGYKELAQAVHLLQRTVLDISKHDVKADEGNAGGLLVQFVDQLRGPTDQAA